MKTNKSAKVTNAVLITWVVITILQETVTGQNYENVTRLRAKLLDGYHMDVRPLNNHSEVMHINISVSLFSLQEADQVKGVLTVAMATYAIWYDQRMTWDPAAYDGIAKISMLMNEVWTPSITLLRPVEFTTMGTANMHVTYKSNGFAAFFPGAVLQSPCKFNSKFWPFDKQMCEISFFPLDYGKEEVQLHIIAPGISTEFYLPNSVWTLDGTSHSVSNYSGFSVVSFKIKLSRQSLFYVITTILPILGIGSLSCFVFLLPTESGERVSFVVTIVLALAVFLTVIEDDLPKSSDPVSLICILILSAILFNSFICFFIIVGMSIFYRDEKIPKNKWHRAIVRISNCRRKRQISNNSESKANQEKHTKIFDIRRELIKDGDVTWQQVSRALDSVMLFVSVLFLWLPIPFILAYLISVSDYPET